MSAGSTIRPSRRSRHCRLCNKGKLVAERVHSYKYTACGLDNVVLYGVEVAYCDDPECTNELLMLERIDELHQRIARELVSKAHRTAAEIRFLQKWLEGAAMAPPPEVPVKEVIEAKNGSPFGLRWLVEVTYL